MNDYTAIQKHIDEARLQRSIYLAELMATAIIAITEMIKLAAKSTVKYTGLVVKSVFKGAGNRGVISKKHVFTFDV